MTEAQTVFAETAILLLHPDEWRRAVAKERVYAIIHADALARIEARSDETPQEVRPVGQEQDQVQNPPPPPSK